MTRPSPQSRSLTFTQLGGPRTYRGTLARQVGSSSRNCTRNLYSAQVRVKTSLISGMTMMIKMLTPSSCEGSQSITNPRIKGTCRDSSSASRMAVRSEAPLMPDRHARVPGINRNILCALEIMLKIPSRSWRSFGIRSSLGSLSTSGTLGSRTLRWLS
jgi:hypothetical protein